LNRGYTGGLNALWSGAAESNGYYVTQTKQKQLGPRLVRRWGKPIPERSTRIGSMVVNEPESRQAGKFILL